MSLADYTIAGEQIPFNGGKVGSVGFDYTIGGEPVVWMFETPAGGTPQNCAATMAGAGTLSGAASVSHALAATLPGAGTLSGTISSPRYLAGSLSGDGILTGAAYCEKNAAATFPGDATMQGAVAIDKKIAAILSGSFQMSARLYQESTPESYGGFVLVYNPTTNTSGKFILKPPST